MYKTLTEKDVNFIITTEPEVENFEDWFEFEGSQHQQDVMEDISKQLDQGNEWVWCTVKVSANYKGLEGMDWLGCCSYRSERDFMESGYYENMRTEALNDLNDKMKELHKIVCE